MKYGKVLSTLNSKRNGAFFSCTWERPLKTKRGVKSEITKQVTATVRKGIDRRNMFKYKSGAEEYTGGALPWGKWKEGLEGLMIEHINSKGVLNNYVRLYTTLNKPKITYFIDGREVSRECIESLVPKSELEREGVIDCFVLNVNSIKFIK